MINSEEIKVRDQESIQGCYKRFDLCIQSGKGAVCWSPEGKKYIDFTSGIGVNSLGFCDEGWMQAVKKQINMVQHTSNLYYTSPCGELAELLKQKTGMDKVFLCNSGAEANEAAIKAARKYGNLKYNGQRNEIITLVNSFHGRTMAAITATGQEKYHKYFEPFLPGFVYAQANNCEELMGKISNKTCAIMVEIIQGEGGVIPLEGEYLQCIAQQCKARDILLIVDEVQSGVGRTGKFFAYEHFDLKPDMVTFAKGMGGGLPIGGVLFNEKTQNIFEPGDHGTTFGGNPVVCAGAVEIVKRMTPGFLENVAQKGTHISKAAAAFAGEVEVTGMGMMIGMRVNGSSPVDLAAQCLEKGLLVLTAGDKLRLLPPLTITDEELHEGMDILKGVITHL